MSQFCPEENEFKTRRCVLGKGHIGEHSLQSNNSATVRQIVAREETLKKLEDS